MGSSKSAKKHISFGRGPRVTMVRAPSKTDHPNLWFQASEKVVVKPLIFQILPGNKISINIGLNVRLTSLACGSNVTRGRTTLEVCPNNNGLFDDTLDERLKKLTNEKRARSPQWFVCGSAVSDQVAKINVFLPAGEYLLKCCGSSEITVFGQAADIERRLE
jgi:hypothetical protein